jgi:cytochrome c5
MKLRTLFVLSLFACSAAWAQNGAPDAAADQAPAMASATAVAVDAPAAGGTGEKVCRYTKHTCKLADQSLAPGAQCNCHDHAGVVFQ